MGHYVALSIMGVDDLPDSGYLRAKIAQEKIIVASTLPYTIVRATQFHEFAESITDGMTRDGQVRVPDALIQPIAGAEVAAQVLAHRGQHLPVVVDPSAGYVGTALATTSLCTGDDARLAPTRFADWLAER